MLRLDDSTENKRRVVSLIKDHISEGMTPDEIVNGGSDDTEKYEGVRYSNGIGEKVGRT